MLNSMRRIVSANKSRFKDDELNLELDLVYVTDRIIIMGYPATGMEGLYRNPREDAIRFLRHRHGQNYWVFNFCPLSENSYDPVIFEGRVSRYPFPDHHAPPFAILPLVVREMDSWLGGSQDRVAVLHCKAGKGRSGTMACAYLLAHESIPSPPKLQRSYSTKEWIKRQIQETIDILPVQEGESSPSSVAPRSVNPHSETSLASASDAEEALDTENGVPSPTPPFECVANPEISFTDALKAVLDLHTSRRMKIGDEHNTSEKPRKVKQGVSIPSQRRFLYYWALVLAQQAPKHFCPVERAENSSDNGAPSFQRPCRSQAKVRLTQINLRMRNTFKVAVGIVKAANMVIDKTNRSSGSLVESEGTNQKAKPWASSSQIWASLSRYDDDLTDLLEDWEAHTRGASGNMARRRPESTLMNRNGLSKRLDEIFGDGKWDKQKMVRSFAKLGVAKMEKHIDCREGKIRVYTLRPPATNGTQKQDGSVENDQKIPIGGNSNNQNDLAPCDEPSPPDQGIILDAGREVRVKLYMGQMFIGWAWFIPTFHMPQPPPPSTEASSSLKATLLLRRDDIDFAIGIGKAIIDVGIEMEWIV